MVDAELRNNKGIALIRKFELTRDTSFLDQAELDLEKGLEALEQFPQDSIDPRCIMLRPNILNNLGNLWKQRTKQLKDLACATRAIGYYNEAESLWSRQNFPYFWAGVQKNKAELILIRFQLNAESSEVLPGLIYAVDAISIRNYEDSPFQWVKSAEIIFSLIDECPSIVHSTSLRDKARLIEVYRQWQIESEFLCGNGYIFIHDLYTKTAHLFLTELG